MECEHARGACAKKQRTEDESERRHTTPAQHYYKLQEIGAIDWYNQNKLQ